MNLSRLMILGLLGLALVVAAFASLALTWRQDTRAATATSALGALAIVGARSTA